MVSSVIMTLYSELSEQNTGVPVSKLAVCVCDAIDNDSIPVCLDSLVLPNGENTKEACQTIANYMWSLQKNSVCAVEF